MADFYNNETTIEILNLKKEDRVGIVMASYNSEKFIREQLDSILLGSYKNIHIYVRDDGSTDNTISIVKEYIEKYAREKLGFHKTGEIVFKDSN